MDPNFLGLEKASGTPGTTVGSIDPSLYTLDTAPSGTFGVAPNQYILQSPLSCIEFLTAQETIIVDVVCTGGDQRTTVLINGAYASDFTTAATGVKIPTVVNLGSPGVSKHVTLLNSVQLGTGASPPSTGSFIVGVRGLVNVISEQTGKRFCVYGDSIASGYNATIQETQGWLSLIRFTNQFRIGLEAWGARSLVLDSLTANQIATQLFTLSRNSEDGGIYWLAIGTNDWGFDQPVANFTEKYAALVDSLLTRKTENFRVFAQTPIVRSGENTPNAQGATLQFYRDAIALAVSGKPVTFVDGRNILTLADLADGTHPTNAGFVKYFNYVSAVCGF